MPPGALARLGVLVDGGQGERVLLADGELGAGRECKAPSRRRKRPRRALDGLASGVPAPQTCFREKVLTRFSRPRDVRPHHEQATQARGRLSGSPGSPVKSFSPAARGFGFLPFPTRQRPLPPGILPRSGPAPPITSVGPPARTAAKATPTPRAPGPGHQHAGVAQADPALTRCSAATRANVVVVVPLLPAAPPGLPSQAHHHLRTRLSRRHGVRPLASRRTI